MRVKNPRTGAIIEMSPPDALGESTIILNGKVVERVQYGGRFDGLVTIGDGTAFTPHDLAEYVAQKLISGEWL